jgi:hypothetical protein
MATAARIRIDTPEVDGSDSRAAGRRALALNGRVLAGGQVLQAVIHNLSSTGMLIETSTDLAGETGLDIEIPEAGVVRAEIAWQSETFFGCQFVQPLPRAAVSAALLRSPTVRLSTVAPSVAAGEVEAPGALESTPGQRHPTALSLRKKTAIVAGLSLLCWAPVVAIAALIV